MLADDSTVRGLRWATSGSLLFLRVGANAGLWTLPFTDQRLDLTDAALLASHATGFSVSGQGTLVVHTYTPPSSRLEWLGRDGSVAATPGEPIADLNTWIALSPEGDRAAYISGSTTPVLFVRDLATGTDTRLTSDTSGQNVGLGPAFTLSHPGWFAGGGRLFYARGPIEASQIVAQRADGAEDPHPLTPGSYARASADGRFLAWTTDDRGFGRLHYAPLDGHTLGESRVFPGTEKVDVRTFDLSPDGDLLAYTARAPNQQGNVYLSEFPGGGARWQATTNGGTSPRFSHDGRELYFLAGAQSASGAPEGRLMVARLTLEPTVRLEPARPLLTGAATPRSFAPAPDGRLLIARPLSDARVSTATLVQNWPQLLPPR